MTIPIMSMSTSSYGLGHISSFVSVTVECIDCHRRAIVPIEEPTARYYGYSNTLERLGLSFMSVPDGWHNSGWGACQLKRCAECFDKWDAAEEPRRVAARQAERDALEARPVLDLLGEMLKQPSCHMNRDLLAEAVRKLRGASTPPDAAVDQHP